MAGVDKFRRAKHASTTITFFVLILGTGMTCAGLSVPEPTIAQEVVNESKSVPTAGEVRSTETGESMYAEFNVRRTQTYTLVLEEDATGSFSMGRPVNLSAGFQSRMMRMQGGQKAVCWDLQRTFLALKGCVFDKTGSGILDTAVISGLSTETTLSKPAKYRMIPEPVAVAVSEPNMKREVLYQGVSKGTVKISFREFVSDMARPAFTQDIAYDLDSDGTGLIAFKGMRIKVLKATGAMIEYQLMVPFSDSLAK